MASLHERFLLLRGLVTSEVASVGPFYATLDTSRVCNLHCAGCPVHSPYISAPPPLTPSQALLDFEICEALCSDLKAMGTKELVLSGDGEPFLHPRIFDIIAVAKRAELKLTLFTNGTFLNSHNIDALISSGLDILKVSLWASSPEEYERNYPGTDGSYFTKVVEGVSRLNALKTARQSRLPYVSLHQPINRLNYRSIGDYVDLALQTKCNEVSFSPFKPVLGQSNPLGLTEEEKVIARTSLMREKKRIAGTGLASDIDTTLFRYSVGEDVWNKVPCYIGWLHARVKVDGTVLPCNHGCRTSLGTLREKSFQDIWNDAPLRFFRRTCLTKKGMAYLGNHCDCSLCCYVGDNLRVHRLYKWLLPLFRPSEG